MAAAWNLAAHGIPEAVKYVCRDKKSGALCLPKSWINVVDFGTQIWLKMSP